MPFNSVEFAIFLPVVFLLYWFVFGRNLRVQNVFLVVASYVFYGWWDWRFLLLIALSTFMDFVVGLAMEAQTEARRKKMVLGVSVLFNLGLLGVFKYFNFFADSFVEAFTLFGQHLDPITLKIILPVGISFYTFQSLSYTIDVYRGKLRASTDAVAFFAYVSFFPQLVAGPIERAVHMLPQFLGKRTFEQEKAVDGLRQMLWGFFKKMVVADNCAFFVNQIFANPGHYQGSTLWIGAFLFAFQIYADFSGYSDIAIGAARLFGFDIRRNFAYPYFSRDIGEFWRRWHLSLTSWFRDYLYIPLGGSRGGLWKTIRNTFIVFLVSGLWHGANWTFVFWGLLQAVAFLPHLLRKKQSATTDTVASGRLLPRPLEFGQMLATFSLVMIGWVFFRAPDIQAAFSYLGRMFSASLFAAPEIVPRKFGLFIILLLTVEWLQREKQHGLEIGNLRWPRLVRWGAYYALVFLILFSGGGEQQFIYFQF